MIGTVYVRIKATFPVLFLLYWLSSGTEDIRLVNGGINVTEAHGILEIFRNNTWKIVCSVQFSDSDARFVCQNLGYRFGRALPPAAYGPYVGNYTEEFLGCSNDDVLNFHCQFNLERIETCLKEDIYYASVYCFNESKAVPEKRTLISEVSYGSVKYYKKGYWGQICAEYWGQNDARVLCRSHGYQNGAAMVTSSTAMVPYTLTGILCSGNEMVLEDCLLELQICQDISTQAAVLCFRSEVSIGLERSPSNSRVGRVVITYDGIQGGVCGSEHMENAQVVCQQLGYHSGRILPKDNLLWTSGNGTYFLSNVECKGTEDNILMCKSGGWNNTATSCNVTSMDLNVICYEAIRLLFGSTDEIRQLSMGQVVIYQENIPTTLCAESFDENAAQVLCMQMGYEHSKVLLPHNFGRSAFSKFTTNVKCSGAEKKFEECYYEMGNCRYRETASLMCYNGTLLLDFSYKLSNKYHGTVLINMFGADGTICRNGWGNKEASVLCKSLGYHSGVELGTSVYSSKKPVWFTKFMCDGNETSLTECRNEIIYNSTCMRDTSPAGAICYDARTGIDIRLVDGIYTKSEGRVEIDFHTEIGTVCDNRWSSSEAKVVCRSLGFAFGKPLGNSYFGGGTGSVYLDNLMCDGSEASILSCPNTGWNMTASRCLTHTNDASVQCEPIAKLGITKYFGPVLFYSDSISTYGSYGLICDDGFFDHHAAKVICSEYGYSFSQTVCCSAFGPKEYVGSYPLYISEMSCKGNESRLVDCSYKTGAKTCSMGQYVSVVCANKWELPSAPDAIVTIYQNLDHYYSGGYIEVSHFAKQGFICTEEFDDLDATVICKSKRNMTHGLAYKHYTQSTLQDKDKFSSKFYWLRDVGCSGNEPSLGYCPGLNWGQVHNCSHKAVAGIFCSDQSVKFAVSLQNGTSMIGRVHLMIVGLTNHAGHICGSNISRAEASVICRDLNFKDGVALKPGSLGDNGVSNVFIDDMKCLPDAKTLHDCFLKIDSGNCDTGPAAVQCYSDVRLAGSEFSWYGRLEIHDGSKWQAVCDENFGSVEAQVVCKHLGFATGKMQCCSALGPLPSSVSIGLSNFQCSGTETHPLQCKNSAESCHSSRYITLLCLSDPNAPEGITFRLPLDYYYGPLLMRRYGIWGYVCDSEWQDLEAKFHCRKLGFQFGKAVHTVRNDFLPIIGKIKCRSSDDPNNDLCSISEFEASGSCYDINTVAGIICSKTQEKITFMQQELAVNNKMAYISVDTNEMFIEKFSEIAAGVFCRSMQRKYVDGTAGTTYSNTAAVINIQCTGNEVNFLQCQGLWDPREATVAELASVNCHYKVRLLGNGHFYGPLEVYKNKEWFQVCGDWISNADADVVCRNLGYDAGLPVCCGAFGSPSRSKHGYESLACTGKEDDVSNCDLQPLTSTSCSIYPASVVCYTGPRQETYQLHLENTIGSGEVKLTYLNVKGRICADSWDNSDAKVICNELGYVDGISYSHFSDAEAQGPYWTSRVDCDAQNHDKLSDCTHIRFGEVQRCETGHSAGVICFNEFGVYYRIVGGIYSQYGRLEVFLGKEWGTICNKHWSLYEAHVTCRHFGYNTGDVFLGPYSMPPPRLTYGTRLQCAGQESSLSQCPHNGWALASEQNCLAHKNDVGVFCYKNVKLHSGIGRANNSGALLLFHQNQWNLVCDEGFSDLSAAKACQELGWQYGKSECCSKYGKLSYNFNGNFTLTCSPDSKDVRECISFSNCNAMQYVSVVCSDESFPTTTVPTTTMQSAPTSTAKETSIIISVVVVASIIIIVFIIVIVKCRQSASRFENFSKPVQHQISHDGSISLENPLHSISNIEIQENSYVSYTPNRNNQNKNDNQQQNTSTASGYYQIGDVNSTKNADGQSVATNNQSCYDNAAYYNTNFQSDDSQVEFRKKQVNEMSQSQEHPSGAFANKKDGTVSENNQSTQRESMASYSEIQNPNTPRDLFMNEMME